MVGFWAEGYGPSFLAHIRLLFLLEVYPLLVLLYDTPQLFCRSASLGENRIAAGRFFAQSGFTKYFRVKHTLSRRMPSQANLLQAHKKGQSNTHLALLAGNIPFMGTHHRPERRFRPAYYSEALL